jgi:hypothetical protein
MTTGIAFGSLSLSSHPGTSSMGQMMLALFCTMSAAVLFQPALMRPPRKIGAEEGASRGVAVFAAEEDEDEFEPVRRARRRAEREAEHLKTKRCPDEIRRRAPG